MNMTSAGDANRHVLVVAAALLRDGDAVCLQRRPQAKEHGGLWEFPGGKVEPGEDPQVSILREIREELGVALDPTSLLSCGFATNGAVTILLYAARRWQGEVRCLERGAELAWMAPADLAAQAMPPLDYPLAEQLVRLLSTGAI